MDYFDIMDYQEEGYPGIAHDLETLREENKRLREALSLCIDRMPTNDPMYSGQLRDAFALARAVLKGE